VSPLASMFGKNDGTPLVVRQRSSTLRSILVLAAGAVGLFALYVMYELGRFNAGYDRQAAAQQRTELAVQIEHLEKSNRELRTQLAEYDTIRIGRARKQAEVAHSIGDLQAQVARQSQELAFYRGVVAQGAAALGVKIEQVRVTAAQRPGAFNLHLSLVRTEKADSEAIGTMQVTLDGTGAAGARTLDLAGMTAGRQRELRYNLRYVQTFDQELVLPAGFKPEQLAIEMQSSHKEIAPISQTFLWSVEATP
jgi:hypothetical protein